MTSLGFFPSPYPDELLYSVLCRYHMRSGNTYARISNQELWGKALGNNLLLPGSIGRIARKLPPASGLTPERFILGNTLFPLFKPFISQGRGSLLIDAMADHSGNGKSNTFAIVGLPWVKNQRKPYLRYCGQCVSEDLDKYGEPYWHRIHQLPGVNVCDKHHSVVSETDIRIDSLPHQYLPPPVLSIHSAGPFMAIALEKHAGFSEDAAWLLRVGGSLGYYEETMILYDKWLRSKGFRISGGKTKHKKLAAAIADYYGEDYLSGLDAYNSGTCNWARGILHYPKKLSHPMYHLLLIDEQRESYRQRWRKLLSENPTAYRSELMFLVEKCHMWLKANNSSWYEANTPATKVNIPKWADSDAEFAASIRMAADEMLNGAGRPVWLNVSSLAEKAGIIGLHGKVSTGRLPLTQSAINEVVESADQWRRRKVAWAICALQSQGVTLTYHKACHTAGISSKVALRLKDFILELISSLYD